MFIASMICLDAYVVRTTHVPVGEDQVQHLEFARHCADQFNAVYGVVLVKPQLVLCALCDPAHNILNSRLFLLTLLQRQRNA